jgi:nitrite reductase/ring-hydroxylating ferredoxin subunit/Fe-S cluster biogenesis protein NfuA
MSTSEESRESDLDVLAEVERAIARLEAHPDPAVRSQLRTVLRGIDAVHRTGLAHLIAGIHAMAGDAFLNRLLGDPAVRLLLMSYNLVAVDRRLQAEEALDAVRGHLHDHGIDVEIREVVGGVVYVRLHGLESGRIPEAAVQRDLEAALKDGFVGFQELVLRQRDEGPGTQFVPLGSLQRARRPVYRRALADAELPTGTLKAVEVQGQPLLLARVDGEVYAVRNRCGDSPLPLEFSRLEGAEIRCSWHGCCYDVRSGQRLDGGGERLPVYPVRVENGEIDVALGTEVAAS